MDAKFLNCKINLLINHMTMTSKQFKTNGFGHVQCAEHFSML